MSATVLADGRVLVTGGEDGTGSSASAVAELYDPSTGVWSAASDMLAPRRGQVATLLPDGRVLVAGGVSYDREPPRFGELFNPRTGTWTKTALMTRWRLAPKATSLADGRVLIAGGWTDCGCSTRRAELYDPMTDRWTATRNMPSSAGSATLLGDGRVLVVSEGPSVETLDTFDPTSGRWRILAHAPADVPRGAVVRLNDGELLFLDSQLGRGERYDPTADAWQTVVVPRTGRGPAVQLDDGSVLVVGNLSSARFDPTTGGWSPVERPPLARDYALGPEGIDVNFMVKLRDGRVLVTEGGAAAIYDPTAGG